MLARVAERIGVGHAAGMIVLPLVGGYLECLIVWARWVRAVQELRRLGRAVFAWLGAIRPDQVCTAAAPEKCALGACSRSVAQVVVIPPLPVLIL